MRRGLMQKSCSSKASSKFDRTKTFESWLKKTKENKKYIFLTRFENGIPDEITLLNLIIGLHFDSIRFVYELQQCGRTPRPVSHYPFPQWKLIGSKLKTFTFDVNV